MRLHHLQIQAFGPFATPVEVDFDALSDAGLFLLTGPTGGGKTSVLDAVCFALYGDVPGDRASAKRLRSDQAASDLVPRVTLECTLSGRRFRIVRSPAWQRPKRRGTGLTPQQATVTLTERVDGDWVARSSRADETGHLITSLVGMTLTQFTQVAMLPQGRFQAFLRAGSDERLKLLQRLFRTGRFEQVERWLRERRLALHRESVAHHQTVADVVSRLSEAAATPPPTDWDLHDLALPASAGDVARWSADLQAAAEHDHAAAREARDHAVARSEQARAARAAGQVLADRQTDYAAALRDLAELEAGRSRHDADQGRLDAARRAAPVVPLHDATAAALAERDLAASEAQRQLAGVAALLGLCPTDVDAAVLAETRHRSRTREAVLGVLLPRERSLVTLREAQATDQRRLVEVDESLGALDVQQQRLPEEIAAARSAYAEAQAALSAVAALETAAATATARVDAAREAIALDGDLETAQDGLRAAVDAAQAARQRWLDLQDERLSGIAAELAHGLAVGASCPVCGSCDHPAVATARPDAPDAAAERRARKAADDAEAERHVRAEHVRDLQTRLALAQRAAGELPVSDLATQAATAQEAFLVCRRQAAALDDAAACLARLEGRAASLGSSRDDLRREATALQTRLESRTGEIEAIAAEVAAELDGSGLPDLAAVQAHHGLVAAGCEEAEHALAVRDSTRAAATASDRRLQQVARDAGFATVAEAMHAVLDDEAMHLLATAVTAYDTALTAARRTLDDAELSAAAAAPAPDLPRLESDEQSAGRQARQAEGRLVAAAARDERLQALRAALDTALAAWAPVRAQHEAVSRLASFVEGKSPDNALQMRLSAFVLAYRLSQVVAAANERLARMSDRRYSLEHTGRRGAGDARGGLSLLVRDDWSGEARDPATLSGGETFVVSLALALGLADVITHEAGGADLDTLFVDEGFGSLDADTLDDVMATLDALRDGGRVVGVVSHVAELRDRIPAQLEVRKSRRGSTLAMARR